MKKREHNRQAAQKLGKTKTAQRQASPAQLVQIEKPIYGGSFLARVEGKAVFVPLALPGESIVARITEEKRGYATAELDEIVTPSAVRIAPACRHFGSCGGCQYQHAGYATQLGLKQTILRETLERAGVSAPDDIGVLAGTEAEAWGYRNRIRLAFDAMGNPGYRSRRSNAVVPIAECPIAAPLLVRAALAFAGIAQQKAQHLRVEELSLFCDAKQTALLATVFTGNYAQDAFDRLAHAMIEAIPELRGIEFAAAANEKSREQAPRTFAHWGEPYFSYSAAGFPYRVDHGAFFQVNRHLVDALVEHVTAGRKGALAWDLFAGVGLFARKLAGSFDRVAAVESAAAAIPGLKANLQGTTGAAVQAWTLDFLRGRGRSERPDLVVVDPPRGGLGPEIATELTRIGAPALTYVSCDPATLARDLRALLASGYTIESIALADLFPQTFHLETVVHMHQPC